MRRRYNLWLLTCAVTVVAALTAMPARAYVCPLPGAFIEGNIRGAWVGVLLNFDGKPGSPHSATIYTTTWYPGRPPNDGLFLATLGEVRARGYGAGGLTAMFVSDKLYIINSRYAPGSNDNQYEYLTIQRFTVQFEKLIPKGEGIVNLSELPHYKAPPFDCSDADIFVPLRQVIESGGLDALWTPDTPREP